MTTTQTGDQMHADDVAAIDELRQSYQQMCEELGKVIVGQQSVIEQLAICLFARGHALLMGQDAADQPCSRNHGLGFQPNSIHAGPDAHGYHRH